MDTPRSILDFPAELYTLLHRGEPGDVEFYQRACQGAASILELGCGAGRILSRLQAAGRHLVGLDANPGMLELAREAAPSARFVEGDMRRFELDARFDRVLIPYNGLFALGGEAHVREALASARAHLAEGGQVLFDVYTFDPLDGTEAPDEDFEPLLSVVHGGELVTISALEVPIEGGWAITYRHEREGGRPMDYTLHHHLIAPERWAELAASVGLRIVARHGGFEGQPPSPTAEVDVFTLGI